MRRLAVLTGREEGYIKRAVTEAGEPRVLLARINDASDSLSRLTATEDVRTENFNYLVECVEKLNELHG